MAAAGRSAVFREKHEEQGSPTIKASETWVLLVGLVFRVLFLCFHFILFYDLVKTLQVLACIRAARGQRRPPWNPHGGGGGWAQREGPESEQPTSLGVSVVKGWKMWLYSSAPAPPLTTCVTPSSYWTPLSLRFLTHKIMMMISTHCTGKIKYRVGKKR